MKVFSKQVNALAALVLGAVTVLTGCGGDSAAGGGGEKSTITLLPKNLGNPYFDASAEGARGAVQKFGGDFEMVGPEEPTPDGQVQYINTAAQQGVDSLVVSANDPAAICDALNQAREVGTKVVTFDSDTEPQCRDLFVSQATAEGIAETQVELMAEQIGGSGQIAVLSASANATNQNAWIDIMRQKLGKNHSDIELVDVVYGNDNDQTSFDKTAALLQSHPNLDGIISPTTVGIAAAARYLSNSQYQGEVALTGLGTPNQMRKYVEDGTVESFALWNPADLGYLAAYASNALVEGKITGKPGESFKAGRLGEYTIQEDGTVILGDPFEFHSGNIDDFDF